MAAGAVAMAAALGTGFAGANDAQDVRAVVVPVPVSPADGQARLHAMLQEAWTDATETWSLVLGARLYETDRPQLNFVSTVRASHCYGLYISAGPVYCSGNTTVFVSVASMEDLARKVPAMGDAGLALLVAHELGHHIQKMTGRFRVFTALARSAPDRHRELAMRFELEADCLAGVWASRSRKFAASQDVRNTLAAAIAALGDDHILSAHGQTPDPAKYTHGSAEQRVRWFKTGLAGARTDVCNAMEVAAF